MAGPPRQDHVKRPVSYFIPKESEQTMLNRHRLTAAAAVIGVLAIAAPIAGANAATAPAPSPIVQGAYQAGLAATQGGLQAGATAAASGWQAGATALQGSATTDQFGLPGLVNLGPTGALGPLGSHGPLGGSAQAPTGLSAWNLGPSGPLGPAGALG
jgi:hypothetical protein